jgi:hypothetical protein
MSMDRRQILSQLLQTPLSGLRLGELIEEAGFPPGAMNICYRLWRDCRGSTTRALHAGDVGLRINPDAFRADSPVRSR